MSMPPRGRIHDDVPGAIGGRKLARLVVVAGVAGGISSGAAGKRIWVILPNLAERHLSAALFEGG